MDDHEIADPLNQTGLTTPKGKKFTYAGVRWIRYKHGISGPYERNRQGISVTEAASLLGFSTGKVYYGISTGKIPARKQHSGWPWEVLIDKCSKFFDFHSVHSAYNLSATLGGKYPWSDFH